MYNGVLITRADSLTLSDDAAVEAVLADIPFFCVGIMAFGVFTFFLVMKRIRVLALYLYISALLAFGSAVLDLSQILARGINNTERGIGLDTVTGIVNTREVGFALSFGFRFLFLWSFVAERPRNEPPRTDQMSSFSSTSSLHSASWRRWGYIGFLLQWSLLVLSISIPALQIIWRIAFRRYDTIYMTESTLQVVVSGLYLLKIALNIFLSPVSPVWKPILFYTPAAAALLLGLGVGVGNVVFFLFSETTLGRFLQAVELYIFILYLLITTFYSTTPVPLRSRSNNPTSSFIGLGEKRFDYTSAINGFEEKNPGFVLMNRPPPASLEETRNRASAISRLSSWMMERVPIRRPISRQSTESWQADREAGQASAGQEQVVTVADTIENLSPRVQSLAGRKSRDLTETFTPPPLPPITIEPRTPEANRPTTGLSFSSYYNMPRTSRMSYPATQGLDRSSRQGTDSPVYGLNGIISNNARRRSQESIAPARASMSSFDELIRQQKELDKSIAALRLFSPQNSNFPTPRGSREIETPPPIPPSNRLLPEVVTPSRPDSTTPMKSALSRAFSTSTNSLSAHRVESASARSDFSLSIFPEPPRADFSSLLAASEGRGAPERTTRSVRFSSRVFSEGLQSIPASPLGDAQEPTPRFGSAGTQYEITSFIGDLTVPSSTAQPSSRFKSISGLSDLESGDESPVIVTADSAQTLRPIVLGSSVATESSLPPLGPASASSGLLTSSTGTDTRDSTPKPFNGKPNTTPIVSSPLSNTLSANRTPGFGPVGPRLQTTRGRSGSSSIPRPKLNISGPRPPEPDGKGDQAPGAFERPRPPPLVLTLTQPKKKEERDS